MSTILVQLTVGSSVEPSYTFTPGKIRERMELDRNRHADSEEDTVKAYFTFANGLDRDTTSVLATMDNAVATNVESGGKTHIYISSNANSSNVNLVSENRPARSLLL